MIAVVVGVALFTWGAALIAPRFIAYWQTPSPDMMPAGFNVGPIMVGAMHRLVIAEGVAAALGAIIVPLVAGWWSAHRRASTNAPPAPPSGRTVQP